MAVVTTKTSGRSRHITEKLPADPRDRVGFTDFINSGRVNYPSVVGKVYEQTNKEFGTDVPRPNNFNHVAKKCRGKGRSPPVLSGYQFLACPGLEIVDIENDNGNDP